MIWPQLKRPSRASVTCTKVKICSKRLFSCPRRHSQRHLTHNWANQNISWCYSLVASNFPVFATLIWSSPIKYLDLAERLSAKFLQLLRFSLKSTHWKRVFWYLHAQLSPFQCHEPYVVLLRFPFDKSVFDYYFCLSTGFLTRINLAWTSSW